MTIRTYRKKPVEIEAVQFTGDNEAEVQALTGADYFNVLDADDRMHSDDPEMTAQVFDVLHSTWVGVYDGQWIIRGVKGEVYPCAADVFTATYEAVQS